MTRGVSIVLCGVLMSMFTCTGAKGQQTPGQGGFGQGGFGQGGPGGGGQGGGFDPQALQDRLQAVQDQARKNAMDNLRQSLGASDDEFVAIEPLLTKVIADNQATSAGAPSPMTGMQNLAKAFQSTNGAAGNGAGAAGQGGAGAAGPGGGGGGFGAGMGGAANGAQGPAGVNFTGIMRLMSSPYGIPPSDLETQVEQAMNDLKQAMSDPTSSPDTIKMKMDAYRGLKAKADEALAKDVAALKQVLTIKQEAALLTLGLVN